jgi:hypothetical protein
MVYFDTYRNREEYTFDKIALLILDYIRYNLYTFLTEDKHMANDTRTKLAVASSLIDLLKEKYPDMTPTAAINHHLYTTLNQHDASEQQGTTNDKNVRR